MEQEEGREVEKKDRERKDKKRHIHALKHPEEGSLYRKTLRSAKRLFEGIGVDSHQKKDWEKPFSGHGPVKRHLSGKSTGNDFGTLLPTVESPMEEQRKQFNPLRFVMNPTSEMGLGERREDSATPIVEEKRNSMEVVDTDHRSSIPSHSSHPSDRTLEADSTHSKTRPIQQKLRTMSSPDTLSPREFDVALPALYERTQSVPADPAPMSRQSDLSSVAGPEETLPKLETITEDNTVTELTDHGR